MKSWSALLRWGVAIPCGALGIHLFRSAFQAESMSAVAVNMVFSIATLLAMAALLAPELTKWISIPIARFIDEAFGLQGSLSGKPALDYRVADYNASIGNWREALFQYERLLTHYPGEMRAHLGAIKSAVRTGLPRDEVDRLRLGAMKCAKTPADVAALREVLVRENIILR